MHPLSYNGTTFNAMLNSSQITQIQERIQREVKHICQNCIVFGVQLTMQGHLSIIVDGSKVLLVTIQEQVDKTNDGENSSTSDFVDTRTMTAEIQTSPVDMSKKKTKAQRRKSDSSVALVEIEDEPTGDCVVIEDNETPKRTQAFELNIAIATTGETITLLLSDSDDDCQADKDKNHFAVTNEEQEYDESTTSAQAFVACDKLYQEAVNVNNELPQITPSTNSVRSIAKLNKEANPLNYTAAPQQLQKYGPNNSAYDASNVNEHQNGYVGWNYMESSEARQISLLSWGTSHPVFKCLTCGTVLRHLSSFLRHKKQHQGMVYRCCVCGKTMNRRDNLLSHQKRHCNGTDINGLTIAHE